MYVIKDDEGNYIAPKQTKKGWFCTAYTGRTTGFTQYKENSELTAKQELKVLNDLGNNFHLEFVDVKSIPVGKLIIKNNTYRIAKNS